MTKEIYGSVINDNGEKVLSKNVKEGKGIDDLHFSSFAIIKSCESYSLMYPKYKKYCQFLKSFFKKYIDDLDNKTLAYMADVVDKSIKLLEQSRSITKMSLFWL